MVRLISVILVSWFCLFGTFSFAENQQQRNRTISLGKYEVKIVYPVFKNERVRLSFDGKVLLDKILSDKYASLGVSHVQKVTLPSNGIFHLITNTLDARVPIKLDKEVRFIFVFHSPPYFKISKKKQLILQ